MEGQMTIWDFIQADDDQTDIETMTDEYLVQKMQEATGLKFTYNKYFSDSLHRNYYEAKSKKKRYELYFDRYTMEDNKSRFISVGYDEALGGAGCPCDSLESAIKVMKAWMSR